MKGAIPALTCCFSICCGTAAAVDRTWFGGADTYNTASNWSPQGAPTLDDNVFLNAGTATVVGGQGAGGGRCATGILGDSVGSAAAIVVQQSNPPTFGNGFVASEQLIIGNRGSGRFSMGGTRVSLSAGSVSLGVEPGSGGSLLIAGGPFTVASIAGDVYVGGSAVGPGGSGFLSVGGGSQFGEIEVAGSLVVYGGGSVQISGGNAARFNNVRQMGGFVRNSAGSLAAGFTVSDTYELNGGSAELRNLGTKRMHLRSGELNVVENCRITEDFRIIPAAPGSASLSFSGAGALRTDRNLVIGDNAPGLSATLRGTQSFQAGTMSAVLVQSNGVLAATNRLEFPQGIRNFGTIRPNEDAIGQLEVGSAGLLMIAGSSLDLSIHGPGSADRIVSDGGLIQLNGFLSARFADGFVSTNGANFQVVSGPISGLFQNPNNTLVVGTRRFAIQYQQTEVRIFDIGAVPEPSAAATILLALAAGRRNAVRRRAAMTETAHAAGRQP